MDPPNSAKGGEHYNLRWTNYLNNLSQIVFEHHINERLVDVTLVCEGQYIKAHKLVLSACSSFFQEMFKMYTNVPQLAGNFVHPFIVMNGIHFIHLKHIIDFMYQGEIKVLDTDLEGVLTLGESLQVKGLCSVKLKQKIGLNNEVKSAEHSVSPIQQTTPSRIQEQSISPLQQRTPSRLQEQAMSPLHNQIPPRIHEQSELPLHQTIPIRIQEQSVLPLPQTDSPRPQSSQGLLKSNLENRQSVASPLEYYSKVPTLKNASSPIPVEENLSVHRSQEEPRNYSKVTLDALAQVNTTKKVNNFIKDKNEGTVFTMPSVIYHAEQVGKLDEPVNKKMKVNSAPLVVRRLDINKTKSDFATIPKSVIKEEKLEKIINITPPPYVVDEKDRKSEIPKPPNAFMIFANEWRKKLVVEHPEETSKEISIRLGNLWKTLSSETKENYYQAAQDALKEHELKYPQTIPKPDPLKKKKIVVKSFRKLHNIGAQQEIVDLQDDDDDLEIIDLPTPLESSPQSSTSTSLFT